MIEYEEKFLSSFDTSLEELIKEWEKELFFSHERISEFITTVYKRIELLRQFPYMCMDVSDLYEFQVKTYRCLLGKNYAFFYRINEEKKQLYIGRIFSTKQMVLDF